MEGTSNGIDGIPPDKVVVEVHKQLINQFHPALKTVTECGANLQRAFQNLNKSADAYIKAVEVLAKSGEKAFSEGKRKATELEMIASTMKNINDRHQKSIEKFDKLLGKLTENCRTEKEQLKEQSHSYGNREKALKKAVSKGQQGKVDLEKFYNSQMDSALLEQRQRYKFVINSHRKWLESYVELLKYVSELIPESRKSDSESKASAQSAQGTTRDANNPTAAASNAENQNIEVEVIVNQNASPDNPPVNGDPDLCKPTPSQVNDDFKWTTVTSEGESPKHTGTSSYFQNLKELSPSVDEDGTLENFVLARPGDPMPTSEYQKKRQLTPPPRKTMVNGNVAYNDKNGSESPDQASNHIEDGENEYENYKYRKTNIIGESRTKSQNRVHSVIDQPMHPMPPVRHSQYIEKHYPPTTEDRPPTTKNDVIYRMSNINAIPTAIVPKVFKDADNGRMLVCKREFRGQTASQLSLNIGDRIVLMKSGSKGWIFAKNVETQRTGWFPSRFVEMLPDNPE